jgi:hypothetical protein
MSRGIKTCLTPPTFSSVFPVLGIVYLIFPWYYSPVLCPVLLVNSFHQFLLVLIPGEAHFCLIARDGKRFVGFVGFD